MAETPRTVPAKGDWRYPLSIGLAIGVSMGVSRGLQANLEPSLGSLAAFAVSLLASAAVASLVAIAVYWLVKPKVSDVK